MSGFKLIAIRPLVGCNPKFRKNLNDGEIYKLYNEFYYTQDDKQEVVRIEKHLSVLENLFGKNISVSAIVGENGSGKSAIIELFVACVNQFSFYLQNDQFDQINQIRTDASIELIEPSDDGKTINAEIYFEKDNGIYRLKIRNNIFHSLYNFTSERSIEKDKLKNFFYTLIINYSLYSFNPHILGKQEGFKKSTNNWIDGLFHKNDSYQIPIVINPKRESVETKYGGVIDINNEQKLLQQRILSNLLKHHDDNYKEHLLIGNKKIATKILKSLKPYYKVNRFKFENNTYKLIAENVNQELLWQDGNFLGNGVQLNDWKLGKEPLIYLQYEEIITRILSKFGIVEYRNPQLSKCYEYIVYKVFSICEKYPDYKKYIELLQNDIAVKIDIDRFLDYIIDIKNRSHITNKLMQVINYIKHYDQLWSKYNGVASFPILQLSEELDKNLDEGHPLIEMLPPPIFSIKVELDTLDENDIDRITIDNLSSGEQQLIHSTSTIVYHLSNLNSVIETNLIVKYQSINLIFDEIELYFHPEYQRQILKNILDGIKNAKLDNLHINIMFITHSPFILSDIPNSNILRLKDGNLEKIINNEETFGANIYDLLANDFFMSKGFIGAFAMTKITEVLDYVTANKFNKSRHEYFVAISLIIGDSVIKDKLLQLLNDMDRDLQKENKVASLEKEMERIAQQLKELRND